MRCRKEGGVSLCLSPSKARHQFVLVVQILLDLLPHVEDGTVPTVGATERGRSVSGVCSGAGDNAVRSSFTLCRAHPHGGNPDSAGTESTGGRNAPPVCSGDRSLHEKSQLKLGGVLEIQTSHCEKKNRV